MSEFEPKPAESMDQQLQTLVAEVESKFIAAEDAMSDLRHAVRQLKAYRPPAQAHVSATAPVVAEARSFVAETAAEVQPEASSAAEAPPAWSAPRLEEETIGVPFWNGPRRVEPEPDLKPRIEDYGLDSTSEASWPIARGGGRNFGKPPVEATVDEELPELTEPRDEDEEARRDEVARIVAQMREGGDEDEESQETSEPAGDDDEARRRDVAQMVADLRGSVDEEAEPWENGDAPHGDDDDRREEVTRMVAELREGGDEDSNQEDAGADESAREDVAGMVARMRAELDGGEADADADDSDEEVRDEVRRAVEAARAEMASGYKQTEGKDRASADKRFSFPDWQTTHMEPSGPPVIVIKDSEGRVELARVYETLSRVNCDENAALLNYTPHSVTVGLNAKASVPEVEVLTEAVRATFGRACEVDSDGVRVNVQIGKDLKGKDSAA